VVIMETELLVTDVTLAPNIACAIQRRVFLHSSQAQWVYKLVAVGPLIRGKLSVIVSVWNLCLPLGGLVGLGTTDKRLMHDMECMIYTS
jgi:hypothetical protein